MCLIQIARATKAVEIDDDQSHFFCDSVWVCGKNFKKLEKFQKTYQNIPWNARNATNVKYSTDGS